MDSDSKSDRRGLSRPSNARRGGHRCHDTDYERPARPGSPPSPPRTRGEGVGNQHGRIPVKASHDPAKPPSAAAGGASISSSRPRGPSPVRARRARAEARASPAGREAGGGRAASSAAPMPIIAPASSSGHHVASRAARAAAARSGNSAAASRVSSRPLSVYDMLRSGEKRAPRIARARERVRGREGPLRWDAREASVRRAVRQAVEPSSRRRARASAPRSPVVLLDESREERVVGVAALEPGGADHLPRAVQLRRDAEAGRPRPRSSGSSHCVRVGTRVAERCKTAARSAVRVEAGETAPVNSDRARSAAGAGSRRRTETTSAPAASAFSHSVAAAIPAPMTRHRDAYSCGS